MRQLIAGALIWLAGAATPTATTKLASPDGNIVVSIDTGPEGPRYSVDVAGTPLLAPSALGLQFEHYAQLRGGLALAGVERRSGEDRYRLSAGKVRAVDDRFNEAILHLAEPTGARRKLDLIVRAYPTGVAFRYRIPAAPGFTTIRLVNEVTEFAYPADFACTGLNLGQLQTAHEGEFDTVAASLIRPHNSYDLPLVCRTARGTAFAVAEADVRNWPAAYLTRPESGSLGTAIRLSRRVDDPGIAVEAPATNGIVSPWRVVMIAPGPGPLIENTLLTSLNPAPTGNFGWVKPGKTAWDWWSGPVLASVPEAGTNDATLRAFVDFAAAMKLHYVLIDDGWYVSAGRGPDYDPAADPLKPVPSLNLRALIGYAKQRDVGLMVWIHWRLLDRNMERILAQYDSWGLKGVKIDFMNRDDQEMIGFYHRVAEATARHHLLLDLHGATHPWGMTRTWPNFLTQEGVLGAEYNKWTRRITAAHNVMLAYTRALTGPMDYTPGGFRNRTPAEFTPRSNGPEVQTTRGAALAMYVVFESPLVTLADTPDVYRGADGLDFVADVPTSWDETRFVAGDFGTWIAVARRKGNDWYVGAMTDGTARRVTLPLRFLGTGYYDAVRWQDGAVPTSLTRDSITLTRDDQIDMAMAGSGGGVIVFKPQSRKRGQL